MTKRTRPDRPHFWLRAGFWRWFARLLVAGILLALAGAVWVLVYPPALDPVRDDLQAWLSDRLERPVRFEGLTWTWDGGLTVRAEGVRVGGEGLAVAEVRLGVAAVPLFQGRLVPRSLTLRGLRLRLERGPHGRLKAGGFRMDPQRDLVFPLLARFERFRIIDGSLAWHDRSAPRPVSLALDGWDLLIERGDGSHRVDLTGRAAGGRVGLHGRLAGFADGPRGWRFDGQAHGSRLDPMALGGHLGSAWPAAVPGPVSLWAEVDGGLGQASRVSGHFRVAPGELRWPTRLRRPIGGVGAQGGFGYRWRAGGHRLSLDKARLTAGALGMTLDGRLTWGDGPARMEGQLRAGELPLAALEPMRALRDLPAPLAGWLDRALASGRIASASAEVSGPLNRFPYAGGGGTFRARARVADVTLAYHPDWPALTDLSGSVEVDRRRLTIRSSGGRVLRARIDDATATVHDLADRPPRLRLQGELGLQLSDGIRFLERSPLQPRGFLEPAVLAGPATLRLGLDLPLTEGGKPDVTGRLRLNGVAFRPRPGAPAVVDVDGEVAFQGGRIRGRDLRGRFLGQAVRLDLDRTPQGPVRAEMAGDFPAAAVRTALARHLVDHPLSRRLTGDVRARLGVVWGREERRAELRADLAEAALILPDPAFIGIGEAGELALQWRAGDRPQVTGTLTTARSQWRLLARRPAEQWRLGLSLGLEREAPACEAGVCRIAGRVAHFPAGQWAALIRRLRPEHLTAATGEADLPRLQAEVQADAVTWRDWQLGGGRLLLSGRSEGGGYVLTTDIRGERAAGRVEWARYPDRRNDLKVGLERLDLPAPEHWPAAGGAAPLRVTDSGLALDLAVQAERIRLGGAHTLTGSRLQAQIQPEQWLLHGLQTRMGQTELRLQGGWRAETGRTALRVDLDTTDFGGWLRSVGVYPSMSKGRGTFGGSLWWPGRPTDFAPAALSGDLRLRMVEGEVEEFFFLSKALATLNVLDWPRQVGRGFKDMAQAGLVYRELRGSLHIEDGVAHTRDWVLESAPLRLVADGSLDLDARTYDLLLHLQPLQTVDRIVSAVPLLGYLLTGDDKAIMALDYRVRGPWADPEVAAVAAADKENFMEALIRRIKEMQWRDILPWR
jgi:uncharacterized protein YhdP